MPEANSFRGNSRNRGQTPIVHDVGVGVCAQSRALRQEHISIDIDGP